MGSLSTILAAGQTSVTTSAQQLSTVTSTVASFLVRAHAANTAKAYIGGGTVTTSTGFELAPGESVSLDVVNINSVYVVGTNGDKVSWLATVQP